MTVVDQIPMPRARIAQVTPDAFLELMDRVSKLEAIVASKGAKSVKEKSDDSGK